MDPEGGGGGGSDPPPPPRKMTKIKGFLSNTGPDPLENYKSFKRAFNVFCWVIIGSPAKRHLDGVSLSSRYWPAFNGIWIISPSKKTPKKHWQSWTPSDKNFPDPRSLTVYVPSLMTLFPVFRFTGCLLLVQSKSLTNRIKALRVLVGTAALKRSNREVVSSISFL